MKKYPNPVHSTKQQVSLIKRARRKGYKLQWRAAENASSMWEDWPKDSPFGLRDFVKFEESYNVYRVVKIK